MQTTLANVFQDVSVVNKANNPLMEVHIVDTNDIFYKKGRILAEKVYRQVWNTENLIDANDYAVVVSLNGNVIGNMNLQLKTAKKALKSETFFGQKHWENFYVDREAHIAETSALAIERNISPDLSRLVMMSLISGIQKLCRLEAINLLVTVQHEFLIRILTKSLHLPFYKNSTITVPQENIPDDDYWNREKPPGLYYLEPLSLPVVESCYSYLTYLTLKGVSTAFFPRIKNTDLCYSTFRKKWNQVKPEVYLN